MTLLSQISERLRAGAPLILVEDPDEALARAAAVQAAGQFLPIREISPLDPDILDSFDRPGTVITGDFLRIYGENPQAVRILREIAFPGEGEPRRCILLESPDVRVPDALRSDLEIIRPALPSVAELREELEAFATSQKLFIPGEDEELYALASAVAGLPRHEAARLFARCWVANRALDATWLRREKAQRVSERLSGALTFQAPEDVSIGGLGNLRTWLSGRREAFSNSKAREYGVPEPKGVLLLGIPGTGKSLTARVVAREWGLPLLRLDAGRLFGSLVGQSESQTREALEAAESCAPCVLWIDEVEKGLSGGKGNSTDGGTSQRVFGAILTWLQEKTKPVFVLATANRVADLPPELLRKGRFDEIFFVDLPTFSERLEILAVHLSKRGRDPKSFDLQALAKASESFGGAELEQAVIDGLFKSFSESRELETNDVLEAIRRTVPLAVTMAEDVKTLREWAKGRAVPAGSSEVSFPTSSGVRRASLLS